MTDFDHGYKVDPFMAIRIMGYIALLYQDLIRSDNLTRSRKLSPVLPIVLYNGDLRWHAMTDVADFIEQVPGGLSKYCPKLEYLLIDEGTYAETTLESLKNLTASLFRLENSTSPENIRKVVRNLFQWLKEPGQSQLRRAFTIYLGRVYFGDRPDLMDAFTSLQREEEVDAMLATRLEEWKSTLRAKYLEEGMEKVAVEMPRFQGTPRTDPGERNYRTGLLPRVRRAGAVPDRDDGFGPSAAIASPVCSCVPR